MAGKVVGITIDITGKTSSLTASLKSADSQLQKTNSALKSVNQALKFDGNNVELLTSKSKLLADAIQQNNTKLDTLKATAEQAMQTLGQEGGTTTEQMAELQAEISRTEQTLAGLETEASNTDAALSGMGDDGAASLNDVAEASDNAAGSMGEAQGKGAEMADALGTIADKAQEVGESLQKHVTEPLVNLGKASISAFKEVDSGYDAIVQKTGAHGPELEELKAVADSIYTSMPVEMETVGAAIGEVNTRFGATGAELESLTTDFLKFSRVTGADVESSVASVDKIMTKFGVDSSSTTDVLAMFMRTSQWSGISVEQLQSSLESNGAALKEMGFDLVESTNLLGELESNGVDASTAMTSLNKVVQNATKDGIDARTALSDMIEKIRSASTETEALQLATDLFGKKGAAEMTQAIREDRFEIEYLSDELSDYGHNLDRVFQDTQDPIDQSKVAFNNLKLAGSELGSSVLTVLTPAIEKLTNIAKSLKEWFDKLDPTTKKIVVTVGLLGASIGPVLLVVASLIKSVQVILSILPAVKGAILAVNAAMAANPILLVTTLLAGLVAGFIILWNNCEEFREFWIYLWENIQNGAQIVFDWLKEGFEAVGGVFSNVGEGLQTLFDNIGSAFNTVGETISGVCTDIEGFFQSMSDTVGDIWNGLWEVVKGVINTMIGGINGMISGVESGVNAVIGALNTLHWEIPDWVPGLGGYGFGFDISKVSFARVPELATGAVIPPNSPFLAVLGDQPRGVNIEAPLATIKDALVMALAERGGASGSEPIYVTAYFGNENFGTVVAQANSRNAYISGGH